jgi:hypothetical protein
VAINNEPLATTVVNPDPAAAVTLSPFKYPDRFTAPALAAELATRLTGSSATGGTVPVNPTGAPNLAVVWVDAGSEVLVHLDSLQVRFVANTALFSIELECDQTGRTPLIVALALGGIDDPAGLIATTDEFPRGNGLLTARWGAAVQSAIWSSLLGLAQDFAAERKTTALGITVAGGVFQPVTGAALVLPPAERKQ